MLKRVKIQYKFRFHKNETKSQQIKTEKLRVFRH